MAEYYYTQGGERQGPVPEDTLRGMVERGEVGPTDYYWTQGMGEWAHVSDGPFNQPVPAAEPAPVTEPEPFATEATAPATAEPAPQDAGLADFGEPAAATPSPAFSGVPAASGAVESPFGTGAVATSEGADLVSVRDLAEKFPKPLWLVLVGIFSLLSGVVSLIGIWTIIIAWIPIWQGVLLFQANGALEKARTSGSRRELVSATEKITKYFVIQGVFLIVAILLGIVGIIAALALMRSGEFNNF